MLFYHVRSLKIKETEVEQNTLLLQKKKKKKDQRKDYLDYIHLLISKKNCLLPKPEVVFRVRKPPFKISRLLHQWFQCKGSQCYSLKEMKLFLEQNSRTFALLVIYYYGQSNLRFDISIPALQGRDPHSSGIFHSALAKCL